MTTPVDLSERWTFVLGDGGFARRGLWLAWFDADGRQLPLVPVDDLPARLAGGQRRRPRMGHGAAGGGRRPGPADVGPAPGHARPRAATAAGRVVDVWDVASANVVSGLDATRPAVPPLN